MNYASFFSSRRCRWPINKSTEGNLERATGTEMGEFPYDYVENPLEVVQVTFEKAVQGLATDGRFDPARFYGKDWGVVDLFRHFVLDNGGFSKVPRCLRYYYIPKFLSSPFISKIGFLKNIENYSRRFRFWNRQIFIGLNPTP